MGIGLKLFSSSNLSRSLGIFKKKRFVCVCVVVEELKRRTIRANSSFIDQTSGYHMRAGHGQL